MADIQPLEIKPLQIENLVKQYDAVKAVQNVHFNVEKGEIFGLLGPNGAGKTSIISVITTLEKPTTGQVLVFGESVVDHPNSTKKQIGVVHQEIINSGFFDIVEILNFQSGYYGKRKNQERIDYVLHKLALYPHRHKKVKQLSGGMKRRLMIAKALVHEPKLLLLDEPTAGVDIELRETLWDFVRELKSQGISILLTTHYLEEAEELCDRVGIINLGKLEFLGPTKEVIRQFTQKKIYLVLNQPRDLKSPYLNSVKGNEYCLFVPMHKPIGEILDEMKIQVSDIRDIRIEEGDLEEAFRGVLKGRERNL
jgi:ABC-2 type transport system ATP-binding protein